tara:strand:+ start:247 stop:474 length:228 start_codon:yes stop_codon:yes gene_type:complete
MVGAEVCEVVSQSGPRFATGESRVDEGETFDILERVAVDVTEARHRDRKLEPVEAGSQLEDLCRGVFLFLANSTT